MEIYSVQIITTQKIQRVTLLKYIFISRIQFQNQVIVHIGNMVRSSIHLRANFKLNNIVDLY